MGMFVPAKTTVFLSKGDYLEYLGHRNYSNEDFKWRTEKGKYKKVSGMGTEELFEALVDVWNFMGVGPQMPMYGWPIYLNNPFYTIPWKLAFLRQALIQLHSRHDRSILMEFTAGKIEEEMPLVKDDS